MQVINDCEKEVANYIQSKLSKEERIDDVSDELRYSVVSVIDFIFFILAQKAKGDISKVEKLGVSTLI